MKINLILLLSAIFLNIHSQNSKINALKINQITVNADEFLGIDSFGYSYNIKNNVFSKTKDHEFYEYKNISLGSLTRVDFQNPLKILVFYENFNTIILLDNQLNEIQKINLSDNEVPIVATATGISSQNRLWIYNNLTQQIGFFDYLKNTFQSITPPLDGKIKKYQSDFNTFHWIDEGLNWYSCTIFGKVTSLGRIPDFDQLQVVSTQTILFSKAGVFYLLDVEKNKTYPIENVEKSTTNFYYKDQILSTFTNQEISNYKIKIP
jgi:hypothetical protein